MDFLLHKYMKFNEVVMNVGGIVKRKTNYLPYAGGAYEDDEDPP
jgi:hypothetical protein